MPVKQVLLWIVLGCVAAAGAETATNTLSAAKDNFGRTNNRNRNSGASGHLLVAHNPSVKSIVGFDLSSITNEIVGAEFSFRIKNTMPTPLDLTIAPMVHTTNNAAWVEGKGALGVSGQNARVGESTYQWRFYRDKPWEGADGRPVVNMMDSGLWSAPIARLKALEWAEGEWVVVKVANVGPLEMVRLSEAPVATFGLWGTAGNGAYFLCSKESGSPPKLTVRTKLPEK